MLFKTLFSQLVLHLKKLITQEQYNDVECQLNRIPFEFIAEKLCKAAHTSRDVIGRKIIAPNKYLIRFSPEDRAVRKYVEPILMEELKAVLINEMKKWRKEICNANFDVRIETDSELSQGQFYIDCQYVPEKSSIEKDNKFKTFPMSRKDLSRSSIPPPYSPYMQDGSVIRTLLNPAGSMQICADINKLVCKIKVLDKYGELLYILQEGKYYIGRGNDADIQLKTRALIISRKHLALTIDKAGMTVKMLGKNGGKYNGENISTGKEFFVDSGDTISVGEIGITLSME